MEGKRAKFPNREVRKKKKNGKKGGGGGTRAKMDTEEAEHTLTDKWAKTAQNLKNHRNRNRNQEKKTKNAYRCRI